MSEEDARPRVLVVVNSPGSGPGRLPGWLAEDGLDPQIVAGVDLPETLAGVAALVLLGGGFMPDATAHAPWLVRETDLTVRALQTETPLLGICLGAQLLAMAAGGEVTASSGETERGPSLVDLLPPAMDDPLFGGMTSFRTLRMFQNHRDSVTVLPPGADLLATSDACKVQAFRVGASAWGVQFHPEVSTKRVRRWDADKFARYGMDREETIARGDADAAANREQARILLSAFADVVHTAARARSARCP